MPLQPVDDRVYPEESHITGESIGVAKIVSLSGAVRFDVNRRRRVAQRFNGAAMRGNSGKFNSIDHQADELIRSPTLLVKDVESFRGNWLQEKLRVSFVIYGNECEYWIVLIGRDRCAPAGRPAYEGIGGCGGIRASPRERRCHLIRAGNLANLEEVGRIAVLEAREIQEHLSIRGLRIVFFKAREVHPQTLHRAACQTRAEEADDREYQIGFPWLGRPKEPISPGNDAVQQS